MEINRFFRFIAPIVFYHIFQLSLEVQNLLFGRNARRSDTRGGSRQTPLPRVGEAVSLLAAAARVAIFAMLA